MIYMGDKDHPMAYTGVHAVAFANTAIGKIAKAVGADCVYDIKDQPEETMVTVSIGCAFWFKFRAGWEDGDNIYTSCSLDVHEHVKAWSSWPRAIKRMVNDIQFYKLDYYKGQENADLTT